MEKKLCLLWQDMLTRSWYHVGDLIQHDDKSFSFYYVREKKEKGLEQAIAAGYHLHPAFPEVEKVYHSNRLFSAFNRRLPNYSRKDYEFLFDMQKEATSFELLALTGGSLYVDSYEFVRPVQEKNSFFEINCFLRAWRHWSGEDASLLKPTQLHLESESNNKYDDYAVRVIDAETNKKIGYIPAFYSFFVTNILKEGCHIEVEYQFFETAAPQYKVKLKLIGKIPQKLSYLLENTSLLLK